MRFNIGHKTFLCVCFFFDASCLLFVLQEKVLHNIMPIFTFMGANIMRLDDTYSFRVIDKTVEMVIPALIKVTCCKLV